jgi:hypothetical protein
MGKGAAMNSYIFLTAEGYTYQADSEACEPDVENLQVLGWSDGETPKAAFEAMMEETAWLGGTTFTECFAVELKGPGAFGKAEHFELKKKRRRKKEQS